MHFVKILEENIKTDLKNYLDIAFKYFIRLEIFSKKSKTKLKNKFSNVISYLSKKIFQ